MTVIYSQAPIDSVILSISTNFEHFIGPIPVTMFIEAPVIKYCYSLNLTKFS